MLQTVCAANLYLAVVEPDVLRSRLFLLATGDQWAARRKPASTSPAANPHPTAASNPAPAAAQSSRLLTTPELLEKARADAEARRNALLTNRFSNTSLERGRVGPQGKRYTARERTA